MSSAFVSQASVRERDERKKAAQEIQMNARTI